MPQIAPANILSQKSHVVHGKIKITEYFFEVPKDHSKPTTGKIKIFARGARRHNKPIIPSSSSQQANEQLPWLCYLSNGPGQSCQPPQTYPWTQAMLDRGYQILYLNQRGTGLSTPITASTLQMRGDNNVQARYLKLYRADSIVRDCEAIRQALTSAYPHDDQREKEKKKWSLLAQGYGGFCATTYLSLHPEGLRECFIFRGLPPLVNSPEEVYRRLHRKILQRNQAYYAKFPQDVANVKTVMKYLQRFGDGKIKLPSEGSLTRRRFRQMLGRRLGAYGGFDAIHDVVLRASYEVENFGHLTRKSFAAIDALSASEGAAFDENVLLAILREPGYCQGKAANWAAERVMEEFREFDLDRHDDGDDGGPVFFTGETVFPWMFEDYAELAKLQDVAEAVAKDADWPALYDEEQLGRNEVPVYAACYMEDMYVDFDFSMETARKIRGCKVLATNVMFEDGVPSRMEEVVRQVFAMRDDVID